MSKRKEFTELLDDEQLELDRQKLQSVKEIFEIFGCKLDKLREEYINTNIDLSDDEDQDIAIITVYRVFEFLKERV